MSNLVMGGIDFGPPLSYFEMTINKSREEKHMKILSRSDILNAKDTKKELVPVPEWGGSVYVRPMSARERDAWEVSLFITEGSGRNLKIIPNRNDLRAKFIAACVVDEDGKLLFTAGDIDTLSQKSAAPIDRIYTVAQRLSGMSDEDMEELKKNLTSDPGDTSTIN